MCICAVLILMHSPQTVYVLPAGCVPQETKKNDILIQQLCDSGYYEDSRPTLCVYPYGPWMLLEHPSRDYNSSRMVHMQPPCSWRIMLRRITKHKGPYDHQQPSCRQCSDRSDTNGVSNANRLNGVYRDWQNDSVGVILVSQESHDALVSSLHSRSQPENL